MCLYGCVCVMRLNGMFCPRINVLYICLICIWAGVTGCIRAERVYYGKTYGK